jgi:hypothetical protein
MNECFGILLDKSGSMSVMGSEPMEAVNGFLDEQKKGRDVSTHDNVNISPKRAEGDHRIYWKNGIKRPLVIPRDKDLPAFIIRNNLRVLGTSTEELLKYLKRQ